MIERSTQEKLDNVRAFLRECNRVIVAFSGGVDSSLMVALAKQELGDRALACIGVSPSYPKRERDAAVELVEQLGARYQLVETEEHLDPDYAANDSNRCYFCKAELYNHIHPIAEAEGNAVIVDGTNASDDGDHRPGREAGKERGVRSPLHQFGITKDEIRAIARDLDLPVWDKPAMACISSRVPHGTPIRPELLSKIERAEDVLVAHGFRQFRVRHHGDIARIELPRDDLERLIEVRDEVNQQIREVGYKFVTIDLTPFRSGSFSEMTRGIT